MGCEDRHSQFFKITILVHQEAAPHDPNAVFDSVMDFAPNGQDQGLVPVTQAG